MADSIPPPRVTDPPPRASDDFRTLRRSTTDRVVAGVLGGLGRKLGIDPVVLRVVTVVLAIFGGVGVLLYAVGWLLIPAEGEETSVLDRALGRGGANDPKDSRTVPLAVALALVALLATIGIVSGSWDGGVLLILAAAGIYLAVRRSGESQRIAESDASAPYPETADFDVPPPRPEDDPLGDGGYPGVSGPQDDGQPLSGVTPVGWPDGPDWGPHRDYDLPTEPAPVPPAEPKQKSVLGPLTFCLALLVVGILAVNDATWASVPTAMYVAAPLLVVALGLLVGTWFGRSRGLIALGILLSLALVPATFVSRWDFDRFEGESTYRYTSVGDVPTQDVSHGPGDVHYDLSDLDLSSLTGEDVTLTVDQAAGRLRVTVPEDADVVVTAHVDAGEMDVFGESTGGLGQRIERTDHGPDGPGGGTITLDLNLGLGDLEVTR